MQVRCIHCGHGFDHEAPSFARGAATTVCPSCGRDTPATEEWVTDTGFSAGGAAVESRVYCFNCGCAMTPREGELIPVCDNCRQDQGHGAISEDAPEAVEAVADWMIRKANSNVYGPFPTEPIIDWIRARKINADEEIAHIGGAWRLFGQHEEFGRFFDSPAETGQQAISEIDFRRRSPIKEALGQFGAAGFAVVALGLVVGGVWFAISNGALVIPESTLDQVADKVSAIGRETEARAPLSPDAQALMTSLVVAHEGIEGNSMEYFLRGRTLMLRDNYANLVKARAELEKAVVLDSRNSLALASLAELYSMLASSGYDSLDLQRQTIYLLQMADVTENYPAAVMRGHAAFLIYSGNYEEGRTAAQAALQKNPEDPALHYLLGVGAMGDGNVITPQVQASFDKALELDPRFHQVWYALAQAEEDSGHLGRAVEFYEKKIASDPGSSASHTRLGTIQKSIGAYPSAMRNYDKAIAINDREKEAFVERAILAYQVEGKPAEAVRLLDPLFAGEGPDLRVTEQKSLGTHLSAALRLSGNAARAIEVADLVLKKDKAYGPALFQRALAMVAAGQPGDAVPVFTRAEDSGLGTRQLARVLFFQGHAAESAGRNQEASESYRRSREVDATFTPSWLWQASVSSKMGDAKSAATALLQHIKNDPIEYARDRQDDEWWAPIPSSAKVAEVLNESLEKESFAPELNAAVGIAWFHAGNSGLADKHLRKAIEEDERIGAALFYRGLIEHENGRPAAAGAFFQGVMDVSRNVGVFYVYLGDALLAQDRLDESLAAFDRGMAYGGKTSWSFTRHAAALSKAGRTEDAKDRLDEAVKIDPTAIAPRKALFALKG
jgi:tetratricopeptide (TPR) repeat protein